MNLATAFAFNENLHEVPSDPKGLAEYILELKSSLYSSIEIKEKVRILGEIGSCLRILGNLVEAESCLREALSLIKKNKLDIDLEVQQKIRLANVLQWMKKFDLSNPLFEELLNTCRSNTNCAKYLAFALQHAGKNLFDQMRFQESLELFNEALAIRIRQSAPRDQIQSTEQAIAVTRFRLNL